MEALKNQPKILTVIMIFFFLMFTSFNIKAQGELKISDNGNLIVSSDTYLTIPGNLTVGSGASGVLKTDGTNITAAGQLNLNAGSELFLTSGIFSANSANINSASTVTYNGSDQNLKNWSYGNLIIAGTGTKTVTGDAVTPTVCNNLTVNNFGNVLSIPENKALTVQSILTNNVGVNGITLASSSSGDGSLISYTSNVDATINRYLTGTRWHYLSSPINSAPLSLFNTNNFMWWDASMDWAGSGDFNPWKACGANLENARGYAYYYYETTIPYKGEMNVGNYSFTLKMYSSGDPDYQGWNLVGNPYTSVLDWDAAVSDGAIPTGAENAIYFFDDATGDGAQSNYRYYVPSSGGTYGIGTEDADGKIPMGQGFFIKTNTDNIVLNFNKNYRTHAVRNFYKNPSDEYIKLIISGGKTDETIVRIVENSTPGFDSQFDARKLFPIDVSIPQMYIIGSDSKITAINSIPKIEKNTIIKLGIKAEEGDYEISLKDLNFYTYDVYLVDNNNNSFINLNDEELYNFHYSGGQNEERFYLTFHSQTSDINDKISGKIKIYPNPASQFIRFSNNTNSEFETIKINSANGKIIYLNKHSKSINEINLSQFSDGVYFIEIKLLNGTVYRNRIILKK